MAKVVDPDDLSQGTEIVFDTSGRTIKVITGGNYRW